MNASRRATATRSARREFLRALSSSPPDAVVAREGEYWIRVSRPAMACRFEITLAGADGAFVPAARTALDEIDAIEQQLSIFRETSTITLLNRHAAVEPVCVPPPMMELLRICKQLHIDTVGAFDITSTPLSRCWGFLRREGRIPGTNAIEAARARVGLEGVQLNRHAGTVSFSREGIELNLGAIGKGYALDRVSAGLRRSGLEHVLISAGRSSLLAVGGRDGGWDVDVVSPLVPGRQLARLRLRNAAVGTSGGGEQFVIADGRRYGHVIDPRTGRPAHGLLSATVVASSAAAADALSTAFLVGGVALARRYCADHPDVLVLITEEGSSRPIVVGRRFGTEVDTP